MNCPVCNKPMVVFEISDVEVDHCVRCRGTWLDAGEMELLLDGAENRDELLSSMQPAADVGEAPRNCPICRQNTKRLRKN